jgi:small GTP-binding protein
MGPAVSGKSCLIKRWVQGYYQAGKKYDPTLGDTYTKNIDRNGAPGTISIRDTAGIYHFAAMRDADIMGGTAFIVTFGVDNVFQWQEVPEVIQSIRKIKGNPPIALCGCKADLVKERGIDAKKAEDFAKANNLAYFESSAKDNKNVDRVFAWALQYVPAK